MAGQPPKEEFLKLSFPEDKSQAFQTSKTNQTEISLNSSSYSPENILLQQFAIISPDILFILDGSLKTIQYINPAASQNMRLNKQQALQLRRNFLRFIVEEDLVRLRKLLTEKAALQLLSQEETEIRIIDGEHKLRFFNLRFTPHQHGENADTYAWLCHARDITDTKTYIKQIKDSKRKLQMALDGSNMGIWSYDPLTEKLECDERVCQFFGFHPDELSGAVSQFFLRIHPDDRAYAILTAIQTLKRQGRFNHEFRVYSPDQPLIRHIAVIGEFISKGETGSDKVTGVCLDISQGKMADNKSKTNEAFLEESQRIAKLGCFDWNLLLDKVTFTSQLYNILDVKEKEEVSLESFMAKIHPEDLKQVQKTLKQTIRKGGQFNHEFRLIAANGQTKVLWAQGQSTRNNHQYTERIIGAIQDISEKKEKEKEINTQNLIIKSILGNLPVIIMIIDKYGTVKSLLGSGLDRIGLDENQTVGESIYDQYPPIGKYIRRVLQGETVHFTEEIEKGSDTFHFLSYYFYDKERELAIGFSMDITAQKKTEKAFEQVSAKNLELERMNQIMDMFVYAVAHDLKNPINNLDMIATLIREATSAQEQLDYLQALHKSVSRLKQTIDGLTEVIEIESSRDISRRNLNFSDVISHVTEDLNHMLQEKEGELEIAIHHPCIYYNEAFLISILKNLLSNAIKYSSGKRKPQIRVKTEKADGFIVLSVSDNGIGIDLNAHSQKMFKPFKRFSRQAEGTGVGLHLIKSMVEKNGGHIEVSSVLGTGTTFTCYLMPYPN